MNSSTLAIGVSLRRNQEDRSVPHLRLDKPECNGMQHRRRSFAPPESQSQRFRAQLLRDGGRRIMEANKTNDRSNKANIFIEIFRRIDKVEPAQLNVSKSRNVEVTKKKYLKNWLKYTLQKKKKKKKQRNQSIHTYTEYNNS